MNESTIADLESHKLETMSVPLNRKKLSSSGKGTLNLNKCLQVENYRMIENVGCYPSQL